MTIRPMSGAVWLLLAVVASSCSTISQTGRDLDDGLTIFMQGEIPPEAKPLQDAPLAEIKQSARVLNIWAAFELARRYEHAIGLPEDLACAAYWYRVVYVSRYQKPMSNGTTNWTVGATGLPQAKRAIERLGTHPEAQSALQNSHPEFIATTRRCGDAVRTD